MDIWEAITPMNDSLSGPCASCSTSGLGQLPEITGFFAGPYSSIISGSTALSSVVKDAFTQAKQVFDQILAVFGIGSGRREADLITPVQNAIAGRLGTIDALVGPNAQGTSDLNVLRTVLNELQSMQKYFLMFLSDRNTFTDGRASQQAANDIMPLIDGTGNYHWPSMIGSPVTTDRWGNPTNGGRIGAVQRRITALGGGGILGGPGITIGGTTISTPVLIAGAIGVYFLLKKGA